jgi:signal recognition particle GTPase
MTENDLTIKILQGIREDLQRSNAENATRFEKIDQRFEALTTNMNERFDSLTTSTNQRFEVIETVLRDMSEQMVMQSRGIRVAIEARAQLESRVEDHERRIAGLEQRDVSPG